MTDMGGRRDTGRSAQQEAQDAAQQRGTEAQQRGTEAQQRGNEARQRGTEAQQRGTEARPSVPEARRSDERRRSPMGAAGGAGWLTYAGSVLVVLGVFQLIWGLTALVNTGYFIVGSTGLAVAFNYMAWAWIHIALAALLICTGLAVFGGQSWGRYVGIGLCAIALIANFLTLAAFPIWSIVMIAVDLIAIYALAVHGRDMEPART
jgi:hypothetical protein